MWITSKKIWLILGAILLIGVFLRFYSLPASPYWMDEGFTINAVSAILEKGYPLLDSGEYYSCPVYCRTIALSTEIFGANALGYRFPSALVGSILIIIIFFFSRRLFGTKVALWSAFFTAFSYFEIAWSRQARAYSFFSLFFWLALLFFSNYFYSQKNRKKWLGLALIICSAVLALVVYKIIGWDFKLNFWLSNYTEFYLREYWLFGALLLTALFLAKKYLAGYKREIMVLATLSLIYFGAVVVLAPIPQYRYLFHLLPVIFILGSLGLCALQEKIPNGWVRNIFSVAVIALFLWTAGVYFPQKNYYLESDNIEGPPKNYYAYVPQPNWNRAYEIIRENKKPDDIVISSQSVFNKIFLGKAGYWIKHPYLGPENPDLYIKNDREYYVGATVIDDLIEFKEITSINHGFIVFDFMAIHDRIPENILNFIYSNFELIYNEQVVPSARQRASPHSQIWLYRF